MACGEAGDHRLIERRRGLLRQLRLPAVDRDQLRIEEMRRRRAGAHQGGEPVVLVAVMAGAVLPIGRLGIVGEDPGTAGIDALGDDAEAGDQLLALQLEAADDLIDLGAQPAHVELRLQYGDRPFLPFEGHRRELGVELLHLGGAEAERQRARDDGPGRGAADQVEVIAEPDLLAVMLGEDLLDPLQERDRDGAAHAAAVEREDALRARPEQMPVAIARESRGAVVHRWIVQLAAGGRRRDAVPGGTMPRPMARSTAHSAAWVLSPALIGK